MVRLNYSVKLEYLIADSFGDFILNIQAARTSRQRIVHEALDVKGTRYPNVDVDPRTGSRFVRMRVGPGVVALNYAATVDISHYSEAPDNLQEMPIEQLPLDDLSYIYPSRYCQSDRLRQFAFTEFGNLAPGYARVKTIEEWVKRRTLLRPGFTDENTSALDTLVEQVGVCRDFAHLMIALCRALNIPARMVTGIDYDSPPETGPTDFHAYVEVLLSGRWYLFDPSGISPPMGLIRIGTGRDAADVSFATLFGAIQPVSPTVTVEAVVDAASGIEKPYWTGAALSTLDPPKAGQA